MRLPKEMKEEGIELEELENSESYQQFLKVALKHSDSVLMTYNKSKEKFDKSHWSFLKDSVIATEETRETAVTVGPAVLLICFRIDGVVTAWLKDKDNIYDFPQDGKEWLDDLCFARNGEVIFASCTHEKFNYMSQELLKLLNY